MNRQMLIGLVGGIGIATAVGGYALLAPGGSETGTAEVEELDAATAEQARPAAATPAPARQPAPEPAVECWEEEVTVQNEPKDDKAIAGTAAGAILGGAIAKKLGDDNDLVTAAGAAAGAFGGRKLQRRVQENNTTTTIETRCEPRQ